MAEPLPYEHLFRPLVRDAADELRRHVSVSAYGLLTSEAHAGWERYLLARLSVAGAKAAHWQFQVFKTVRAAFPREETAAFKGGNFLYRAFVGEQPAERLQRLFCEFPALAELCDLLAENWLAAVAEFLHRLDADRKELGDQFKEGYFDFPVTALEAGLSDPHRGGRTVVRLHFENGTRLIYKPRSLAPEAHFSRLLEQLNKSGIPWPLRSADCWIREGYGWMEDVEHTPCRSAAEISQFYWRAGALLGLVYLACGVDFHRENLIAAGPFPVLVDLESLWHPKRIKAGGFITAGDSVQRTGFLPQNDPQLGPVYELGALSRHTHIERATATWVDINQDSMVPRTELRERKAPSHLPLFADTLFLAVDYVPQIQAGFRWVGDQVLGNDPGMAEFGRWLRALIQDPRRMIPRATAQYQAALEEVTTPRLLREKQVPADLETTIAHLLWPPLDGEMDALRALDVPYFEYSGLGANRPVDSDLWKPTKDEYEAQAAIISAALAHNPLP